MKKLLFAVLSAMTFAVVASPASAVKVAGIIKNASKLAKAAKASDSVIDAGRAIKGGNKVYQAKDLVKTGVRLGKGMLGKCSNGVGDDVVDACSKLIAKNNPGSLSEVGEILAKYASDPKLTAAERDFILNDAYLRIAARAGRITGTEADDALRLLKDADGLHALVRKCCSANSSQAAGHMFELRQAMAFQRNGFDVLGLGVKYADGIKKAPTDLDLLIRKGQTIFLVESKHYMSTAPAPDMIRADADSLLSLRSLLNGELGGSAEVKPIFTFVKHPGELLSRQLEKKGVAMFVGESDELAATMSALY